MAELLAEARTSFLVFDPDLSKTGLESAQGEAMLLALVRRELPADAVRFLLRDASRLERDCPRLTRILSRFSHCFQVRTLISVQDNHIPESAFVISEKCDTVTRLHRDVPRGRLARGNTIFSAELLSQFETLWLEAASGPTGIPLGL